MSKTAIAFGLGALVIGFGLLTTAARGATGGAVIAINQSKVPFTINTPGSYKLTSDLFESDPTIAPVTVTVSGVTIDLNGFSISGGSWGIYAAFAPLVTIQNGQVSGATDGGIITGHSSRIVGVRVFGTQGDGIDCADGCEVDHCIVNNNGQTGIRILDTSQNGRAVVSSNVVQYNGAWGIVVGKGASLVTGNAINNTGVVPGFAGLAGFVGSTCAYSNNVFDANGALPAGCFNLGQNACTGTACP